MKTLLSRHIPATHAAIAGAIVVLGFGGGAYAHYTTLSTAREENAAMTTEMGFMRDRLAATEEENGNLRTLLQARVEENDAFGKRVEELANTVGFLDKLSKTDRELLQKYSSVYFLSENFTPDPLVPINDELLLRSGSNAQLHGQVYPFLEKMMGAALRDSAPLLILSAYRSFGTQSVLKASYKVTYGAGTANQFSAEQGYSEHQLGSAVDFTTAENDNELGAFKGTDQYRWLVSHAHEYGFVLSYPEGNDYFQFEPWHWRFVGVDLATRLYHENKNFYDLDQREINPYLVRIFD